MNRMVAGLVGAAVCMFAGCGGSPMAALPIQLVYPNVSGNWQIQSGPVGTPVTGGNLGVAMLGGLQSTGSQVTGTFRFVDFQAGNGCGAGGSVISVAGSVDTSGNLMLTSSPFAGGSVLTVELGGVENAAGFRNGTIAVKGATCSFASSAAIGVAVPSLSGTYTGSLISGLPSSSPGVSAGTTTLTLTQAATAQADGQFQLTGEVQYALGNCTGSVAIAGSISGLGGTLTSSGVGSTYTVLDVIENPATPSTLQVILNPSGSGCSASGVLPGAGRYSGTLTKQ